MEVKETHQANKNGIKKQVKSLAYGKAKSGRRGAKWYNCAGGGGGIFCHQSSKVHP